MVTNSALAGMVIELLLTLLGPVILLIVWRKVKDVSLLPALWGALVFLVFAKGLESIPHYFFLVKDSMLSQTLKSHAWLYALYGGLAAGIFEESGRLAAYTLLLKKSREKETAITYGIGHGGIECMFLVGLGVISALISALSINKGTFDMMISSVSGEQAAALEGLRQTLVQLTFGQCMIAVWERAAAMVIHISLSVMVFAAVRLTGKKRWFLFAILIHAVMDVPAALFQAGAFHSTILVETITTILAAGTAFLAWSLYRHFDSDNVPQTKTI
jgi:uncharacterized membrane protein YhfC